VNKEAKQFRGKPLQYREQLDEIFDGTAADGRFAQDSDFPIDPECRDELSTLPINPSPPLSVHDSAEGAEGAEVADAVEEEEEEEMPTNERDPFQSTPLTIRQPLKRSVTTPSEAPVKRSKRTVQDTFARLVDGIELSRGGGSTSASATPLSIALTTLQGEYSLLKTSDFNNAVNLLLDEQKCVIFNSLKSKRRDDWLRAELASVL
jgi:hypothetical protein